MRSPGGWKRIRRHVAAQFRDLRILIRQFFWSILGFNALIALGGWALHRFYDHTPPIDYWQGCYAIFTLIFFQPVNVSRISVRNLVVRGAAWYSRT